MQYIQSSVAEEREGLLGFPMAGTRTSEMDVWFDDRGTPSYIRWPPGCINQVCQVLPPCRSEITLMSLVIKLELNGLHRPNRPPVKIRPDLSGAQISSESITGQI